MERINVELKELFKDAFKQFTARQQVIVAIEELSELQKELCKEQRFKYNKLHMIEELTHALFMIHQMIVLYDVENEVSEYYDKTIKRLEDLLE